MSQRVSRRAFLKLSAAGLAGWGLSPAWAAPLAPRLVTTLPVPFDHRFVSNPDSLLARQPAGADLLLVPAYIAVGLVARGWVQRLPGPPGRAHDPEGAYTVPYRYAVSAFVRAAGAAPNDPWHPTIVWPAFSRLLLGAALQRRGFSPNDSHAGHLAQAGEDLLALRPLLTGDPLAAVQARAVPSALAAVPVAADGALEAGDGLAATLPPWGTVVVEYDWVLPANAPEPATARTWLAELSPPSAPALPEGPRWLPLAPLPERAQAQHARLWAELARGRRAGGA